MHVSGSSESPGLSSTSVQDRMKKLENVEKRKNEAAGSTFQKIVLTVPLKLRTKLGWFI